MSTEENPTPEVEVKDLENTATPVSGRQQVIERLQEIAKDASNVTRQELDQLKQMMTEKDKETIKMDLSVQKAIDFVYNNAK